MEGIVKWRLRLIEKKNSIHPHDLVKQVKTKEDFIQFIHILIKDLNEHKDKDEWGEEWANVTLEGYLGAMAAWINDHPRYNPDHPLNHSQNSFGFSQEVVNPEEVSWKEFAHILYAAKIYE